MINSTKNTNQTEYNCVIPSRAEILDIIKKKPQTGINKIKKQFSIKSEDQRVAIYRRLKAMIRDLQIVQDSKGKYKVSNATKTITGRVQITERGFGFLLVENGKDIFLSQKQADKVWDNDLVEIAYSSNKFEKKAVIIRIIETPVIYTYGTISLSNNNFYLNDIAKKSKRSIKVANKKCVKDNAFVKAKILRGSIPSLEYIETVKESEIIHSKIDYIKQVYGYASYDNNYEINYEDSTATENRLDLRHLDFVTIDGDDSKDFDDAVYIEKKQSSFRLYVAIADVAHYVKAGSHLDLQAYEKGNSVYFPTEVVPMLPFQLSNDLCSLNENQDKQVLVAIISINNKGIVDNYVFKEAVIKSKKRFTYNEVQSFIDKHTKAPKWWASTLKTLIEFSDTYRDLRMKKGSIQFITNECKIKLTSGKVTNLSFSKSMQSQRIIEDCMLCANVSAAKFLEKHNISTLNRSHESPNDEKYLRLVDDLSRFNIKIDSEQPITAETYNTLINSIADDNQRYALQIVFLRSMMQAKYSVNEKGHFGLGFNSYVHFTSPIRRYSDLVVHRQIKNLIHNQSKNTLSDDISLEACAKHISNTERMAESATRSASHWIKCHYLVNHVGSIESGIVTGITKFGIFVELIHYNTDGLVHYDTEEKGVFSYQEK